MAAKDPTLVNYKALVGLDYPPDRRVEAGEIVSDIPSASLKWLVDQGLVEISSGTPTPTPSAPVVDPTPPVDTPATDPVPPVDAPIDAVTAGA